MKRFDVAVFGGGPAGIAAAVSAARGGAETVLFEQYGFLGGMATAGMVTPISEFCKNGRRVIGGVGWELMERMHALGGAELDYPIGNVPFDVEIYKLAAQRMVLEAGAALRLHAVLADGGREGRKVTCARVVLDGGLEEISAGIYVDCTSNATLAASVGAPMQETSWDKMQPASLIFRMANVDTSALDRLEPREQNRRYYQKEIQEMLLALRASGEEVPPFGGPWFCTVLREGVVNVNMTRVTAIPFDPADRTRAECELREHVFRFAALLKRHVPAFRNSYLLSTGVEAGFRESRRLLGAHVLSGEELLRAQTFPDVIARCAHPVDIHHAQDSEQTVQFLEEAGSIPYRCLYTPEIENLLVAGRCISADRAAFASARVQAPVMAVGQAAGTAAALCVAEHQPVWNVEETQLQALLRSQNAIL